MFDKGVNLGWQKDGAPFSVELYGFIRQSLLLHFGAFTDFELICE